MYTQNEINLANEIAEKLNDKKSISLHLTFVRTVPEEILRELLAKVMATPEEKIKNSRGALYNFLVQQYVNHTRY